MSLSKPTWIMVLIAVLALGAMLFIVWGRRQKPLAVGDRVPRFTLQQVNAAKFSFKDDGHGVVLVNFWATWCPPCVEEAPSLEKFAQQMQPLGVRVIGVSVDQDGRALQKFISDYHLTYPILRDPSQSLASRFGTYKFPETYIFDRNGRLADKIISATDWEDPQMIRFVQALVHWPAVPKTASNSW